jgi:hypothetical protein
MVVHEYFSRGILYQFFWRGGGGGGGGGGLVQEFLSFFCPNFIILGFVFAFGFSNIWIGISHGYYSNRPFTRVS